MLLKLVEYHWAEHIDDALLLLGRPEIKTVPLAGGTYLLGLEDDSIQAVVDLRDLGLSYVREDQRSVHIGAMTTLQEIVDTPLLKEFATGLLSQSAQVSSPSRLLRQSATIGGTVAVWEAAQADILTALVALDAEVVVRSARRTEVNLSGGTLERPGLALSGVVYKGKQERRSAISSYNLERRPGELIIEINVPKPSASCGASLKRIGRMQTDSALLNAAALVEIENDVYKRVRLIFGGVNMEPMRVLGVEQILEGQPISQPVNRQHLLGALRNGMAAFRPPSDALASSGYRRVSGVNLAFRVLEEATNVSHWRSLVSAGTGKGA
jgi:CO/xanthine dehydrogenase FAD-binding subunit